MYVASLCLGNVTDHTWATENGRTAKSILFKKRTGPYFLTTNICVHFTEISRAAMSHGRIHAKLGRQKKRAEKEKGNRERERSRAPLARSEHHLFLSLSSLSFSPMVPSFRMRFDLRRGGLTFPNPAWPSIRTHARTEGGLQLCCIPPRIAKKRKEKGE